MYKRQVKGKVVSVRDFGVFVEIEEGLEGLIHISDLSWGYVKHPQEVVKVCLLYTSLPLYLITFSDLQEWFFFRSDILSG